MGLVNPDKRYGWGHQNIHPDHGGSGGAAKIIYVGSFLSMVGGNFCNHSLDLPIERHRSAHHVIKYTGYLGAKFKVGHYFDLFVKNLINFSVLLLGHYVLRKYSYLSSF